MEPESLAKRGRGRPRKYPIPDPNAPKRGRGRPRKDAASEPAYQMPAAIVQPAVQPSKLRARYEAWRSDRDRVQLSLIVGAIALLFVVVGGYQLSHPKASGPAGDAATVVAVRRLTVLPDDETPQILRVVDETKLDQPFLKDAQNGDVVLIYGQSSKAILYRPKAKKIIAIGPLSPAGTTTSTDNLRLGLYSGTATGTIAAKYETQAKATLPGSTVVIKEKATDSYQTTIVVDLSGTNAAAAEQLAKSLGATVTTLPVSETRPKADLLVIFGADKR